MTSGTDAVGVFVECDGKILILQRRYDNYQGGNWDVPGGRLKPNESPIEAIKREISEEVGYVVDETFLEHIKTFNWEFKDARIIFRAFRFKILKLFEIKLNPKEHTDHKWVTPEECYAMKNLIHGFHDILEEVYLSKKSVPKINHN